MNGENERQDDDTVPRPKVDPGGWAPYLDPGEDLLWEGRPNRGVRLGISDIFKSMFGLVFFGFAVFWITMASSIGGAAPGGVGLMFPLFGLPFVLVGAYFMVGRFFWDSFVRSKTVYALTTKRGIIARSAFGRSLKSYPIKRRTEIEYLPGEEATIYFGKEERRGKNGTYTVKRGFEYINGGDQVYRLMRAIQQGRLGAPE